MLLYLSWRCSAAHGMSVPWPGPPAVGAWSPNPWAARDVPALWFHQVQVPLDQVDFIFFNIFELLVFYLAFLHTRLQIAFLILPSPIGEAGWYWPPEMSWVKVPLLSISGTTHIRQVPVSGVWPSPSTNIWFSPPGVVTEGEGERELWQLFALT